MMRWIAVGLLSISWMLGLKYYHQQEMSDSIITYEELSKIWTEQPEKPAKDDGHGGAAADDAKTDGAKTDAKSQSPEYQANEDLAGSEVFWQYVDIGGSELEVPYWLAWFAPILLAVLCLQGVRGPNLSAIEASVSLALTLIGVLLVPWPFKMGPILLAAGLAIAALASKVSIPERLKRLSTASAIAGCLLLAQGIVLVGYKHYSASSRDLPQPLPEVIGTCGQWMGQDIAVHDNILALHSMRVVHRIGATWDLLLDPASLAFLTGLVVLIAWQAVAYASGSPRWNYLLSSLLAIALILLWLPLRAATYLALYMHDVLRLDYDAPMSSITLFWKPWPYLLLLIVPILIAWRLASPSPSFAAPALDKTSSPKNVLKMAAAALAAFSALLIAASIFWDPPGQRMDGRVLVEEFHSDPNEIWEPTFKAFDTEWYGHDSGYNYYCIYEYCKRFFTMSRWDTGPLTTEALENKDVLIIKVPKREFSKEEIDLVVDYVENGGGLLLIGEHTNVFDTGAHLNSISRRFGFKFRHDCLFGIDSVFDQRLDPTWVGHPIVQHMPPMEFATSASIDPGTSKGRAVICESGLKNAMADYHTDNYYPQPVNRPDMRYGAFVQLWTMRYGEGRVAAFADSTIFSNFATFEPGKAELFTGMIEWLNHRPPSVDPRGPLLLFGLMLLAATAALAWGWTQAPLVLTSAGIAGCSLGALLVQVAHSAAMPPVEQRQQAKQADPITTVAVDRNVCSLHLPKNGFVGGKPNHFGIFERWILRVGYYYKRPSGMGVFDSDMCVFFYPDRDVDPKFKEAFDEYVSSGGHALILDSFNNKRSTANQLLEGLDIEVDDVRSPDTRPLEGPLVGLAEWKQVPVENAIGVRGGTQLATIDGAPVAAVQQVGEGTVTVIGFAARFDDYSMGITADVEPKKDSELRQVMDIEYSLLRDH